MTYAPLIFAQYIIIRISFATILIMNRTDRCPRSSHKAQALKLKSVGLVLVRFVHINQEFHTLQPLDRSSHASRKFHYVGRPSLFQYGYFRNVARL